jgi:N-acetylneuraminic acid mutarotase
MRRPLLVAAAALTLAATLLPAGCGREPTDPTLDISLLVVSGDGQQGTVGTTLAQPLIVQAVDARGRALKYVAVRFQVTSGGGSVATGTVTTDVHGKAQDSWTLGTSTADSQRLEVRLASTNQLVGTFRATANADRATRITVSAGDSQVATRGTAVPIAPAVLLTDRYGNPAPGWSVTFAILEGGGSLAGAVVTSGANGIATVGAWTLGAAVGTNRMWATAGGLTPAVFTATATVGTGARMVIHAGNDQTTAAGDSVAIPPAVRITDATGSPIPGVRPTFSFVQGGASFFPIQPTSDVNGVASLSYWWPCCGAGTYIIRAAAADIADTVFFTATVTPGAPRRISLVSGNGQSGTTGTAVAFPPTVLVRDTFYNPTPGVSVTFTVTGGNGTVTGGAPATTNANGVAAVGSWTLGPVPGANSLIATVVGAHDTVTFTATATPRVASASRTTVTAEPATIPASTGSSLSTITVVARDGDGVPIEGTTVVLTASGINNTLTQPVGVTDANGVATGTLSSTARGAKTVSATVRGVAITQTAAVTVTAGPPMFISILRGDHQTAGIGTPVFTPPAVIAGDTFHNSVPGVAVTFTVTSGGGSVSGPNPVVTNGSGIAEVGAWTLGGAVGTNTLTAAIAGSSATPATFTATAVAEFWARVANMPTPRQELAAAAVNGIIYAIGGGSVGGEENTRVEAYDPAANQWTARAVMPTPRTGLAAGVANGVLYAVGGWSYDSARSGPVATLEAYDPVTNTWTSKTPMPTARYDLFVAVIDGILYAMGGHGAPTTCYPEYPWYQCYPFLATVEAYDPATDTWTTRASLPSPRLSAGTGTLNGIIYVAGGQDSGTAQMATLDAYDPSTDTWTSKAPMPTPRFGLGAGVIDGILYAVGGYGGSMSNEAYDPATDTWTTRVALIESRQAFGTAVVNGRLYIIGGLSSQASNWRMDFVDYYQP